MSANQRPKKDWWDKADVLIKGVGAATITSAITAYAIFSERQSFQISEKNRSAQTLVQTMNNRELASADMRAKMFDTLMTHYFRFEHDATNDLSSEEARRQKHTIPPANSTKLRWKL